MVQALEMHEHALIENERQKLALLLRVQRVRANCFRLVQEGWALEARLQQSGAQEGPRQACCVEGPSTGEGSEDEVVFVEVRTPAHVTPTYPAQPIQAAKGVVQRQAGGEEGGRGHKRKADEAMTCHADTRTKH